MTSGSKTKTLRQMALGGLVGAAVALRMTGVLHGQKKSNPFDSHAWYGLDPAFRPYLAFSGAAFAGWFILSLYWELAARNAPSDQRKESSFSRALHVVPVSIAQLLVLAPIRGIGRWAPASPLLAAAGLAILAFGVGFALWARRHLGRNWSGAIAIKLGQRLVRSGPYRFLRHPIYTGLLMMYVGSAVLNGEWLAVCGVVLAFLSYWRKIRLEESALREAFGADYAAYRKQTWALVPGVL